MKDKDSTVSFTKLTALGTYLFNCTLVDPEWRDIYNNTVHTIDDLQLHRVLNFLDRHHLYGQFIDEDEQGKR